MLTGNYSARLVSEDQLLTEGAVEIFLPDTDTWVTVVNTSFDLQSASAVCSTLRYPLVEGWWWWWWW